jgi:predicted metalloprotease
MRFKKLRRREGGIVDRRGRSSGGLGGISGGGGLPFPVGAGGLSLGSLILLVVVIGAFWLCGGGGSPFGDALSPFQDAGTVDAGSNEPQVDPEDPTGAFVDAVLDDVQVTWIDLFERAGKTYQPTSVVLFTGSTRSACGTASQATGPFYCPADRLVYLDTSFFKELERRFGAPGDFAQAYVIAHEVGHHVQNLLGITDEVHGMRGRVSQEEYNALSVRLELQADFLAGVWAHHTQRMRQLLEQGDIEEALNAASAIGDDRLQQESQGHVVPDSFTHGTSEQRARWFRRGFETGDLSQGDTFNARVL